jgi:hypothetical protein
MNLDVRLCAALPAVFRACPWALHADLRITDARSDAALLFAFLRLCSFGPLVVLVHVALVNVVLAQTIFCISIPASYQKVQRKPSEMAKLHQGINHIACYARFVDTQACNSAK